MAKVRHHDTNCYGQMIVLEVNLLDWILVMILHSVSYVLSPPFRAVILVRRTKGENRRGRSHPLRCDRQRWYGGTRGRETGGVSGEAAPYALSDHTKTSHSAHPPDTPLLLQHFRRFSRSLTSLVYFLLWTDLCMPFLDSAHHWDQCYKLNLLPKLHDLSAER